MERISIKPRDNYKEKVESLGLIWHSTDSENPYWKEDCYYQFDQSQIEDIKKATKECYEMFIVAGQYIVDNKIFHLFDIPKKFHSAIISSWTLEPPALNYGRFDFAYGGGYEPKLMEFNCDTPTSLLESSIIQWYWKEDVFPKLDQFNSIHEHLVDKWKDILDSIPLDTPIHFTMSAESSGEDQVTTSYMADIVREAGGCSCVPILINDIGWNGNNFVDLKNRVMDVVYKLYPWEWMVNENFSDHLLLARNMWVEPIWKMIWSNKAILPILSDLFPDSPYIAKASFIDPSDQKVNFVRKPILSREGANVTIFKNGSPLASTNGEYGEGRFIYQELIDIPSFEGRYPVIGSWIVDGEPCGVGIREGGLITDNLASFIPHVVI